MLRIFDELNDGNRISIPYDVYFGEMDLTDNEKEERKELARQFEVLFLFLLLTYRQPQIEQSKEMLQNKYKDIAMAFIGTEKETSYIADYSKQIIDDVIRATNDNIDDPYYLSWDRAIHIAENEANAIGSYRQHIEAVKAGKKYKTWLTMNDNKVRHTHKEIDSLRIPIFEAFQVGDSKMMFPKSSSGSPEETINCRCICEYS